ncbi:MAG: hypothetical protein B6A08_14205 [Sorangiineae bacterium NIC37A_2]|nr:MAG: hypothetical protein B6A08_14205 [Sorangiineae bacterium NIC37A_2]
MKSFKLVKSMVRRLRPATKRPPIRPSQYDDRVLSLGDKLWEGFSPQALVDLHALRDDPSVHRDTVARAARELARYYRMTGDWAKAQTNAAIARVAAPGGAESNEHFLLEADCLVHLGRSEEARQILTRGLEGQPDHAALCLAMANTLAAEGASADQSRLDWINRPLRAASLPPIEKRTDAPLTIWNLVAKAGRVNDGPLVSVIVPAFNAEETIERALLSITEQTWANIEIIVVDDQSRDRTFELAMDFARRAPRVRVFRTERNSGAYVARNLGLSHAQGQYVTVHDADDWSHPKKIELQVTYLEKHSGVAGTVSEWVRSREDLFFVPLPRLRTRWVYLNASSLMLRRQLLEQLGGWDSVRVGADSELLDRLKACRLKVETILPNVPLSFGLVQATSLTQSSSTSSRTRHRGIRREYHAAASYWHRRAAISGQPLRLTHTPRPFPAPPQMLPQQATHPPLDLIFIADFNFDSDVRSFTMDLIHAALRSGLRVGVFHYRRYHLSVTTHVSDAILELAETGKLVRIAPGEEVSARIVLALDAVPLQHVFDLPPLIKCGHFVVAASPASAPPSAEEALCDPTIVGENVRSMFGCHPVWLAVSGIVRELMTKDRRYDPVCSAIWSPLIDTETWCTRPIHFRGGERAQPVIGRGARDNQRQWPLTPEVTRLAYCADLPCEVRIMGAATVAVRQLGRSPANWRILPAHSLPRQDFLSDLDFYVHFPHEGSSDEFERGVLEAMAVGVPVILPPSFESTFGQAALYCEPNGVWPLVEALWTDEVAWRAHAQAGRDFALEHGWSVLPSRLSSLENELATREP